MTLNEEQLQHFYREGYVVVPGLVPRPSVEAVLQQAPKQQNDAGGWKAIEFVHDRPLENMGIHGLLTEPNIIGAVEDIFGAPARVFYGMLVVVPARGGNGLPWHQDNQYMQIAGCLRANFGSSG